MERFGSLQALMAASLEDLRAVDGVDRLCAHTVREQLSRMAESSLEEYAEDLRKPSPEGRY